MGDSELHGRDGQTKHALKFRMMGSSIGPAIIVDGWRPDEEFHVFPVGSKPKRMLISPDIPTCSARLIPGHAYLFKTAQGRQLNQHWSEIIAYKLGVLCGVPVPPCFLAMDTRKGEVGALVEFFYGYPGEEAPARLIHGADVLARMLTDKKRGRPHSIRFNVSISKALTKVGPLCVKWWATVMAFDALIGNTDRHPENWGFLVRSRPGLRPSFEIAPAFDNGTSLGYEILEAKLQSRLLGLNAYVARGLNHAGWDLNPDGPLPHNEICRHLAETYEDAGAAMESVIRFDVTQFKALLDDCCRCDVPSRFSEARAEFVYALVLARKAKLESLLAGL